jgi:hypothetical protein
MHNLFKVSLALILFLSFHTFAGMIKNSNFSINVGINHSGFEYINSASYFTDNLHVGPNIGIEFKHQFWKYLGYSVGFDYCILGGNKSFSFLDSVYQYDSSSMTYQYVSTELFEGSYAFNLSYASFPIFMTCKIANLPLEAALGPSIGYIFNQERVDYTKGGNGAARVIPIDNKRLFHSRLNASIRYNFIKKPLSTSIGIMYSHGLTKITSALTSRGIQNTNEFRLYLSVSIL